MAKLTFPEALTGVGTVQIDSDAGSLQVKVIVPEKPEATATATVAFTLAPCVTWKLVAVGVSVNAGAMLTTMDPAVWLTWLKTPVVAVMVTVGFAAAVPVDVMLAVVVAGAPPLGVTVVGLNEQVAVVGSPEHAKFTAPLKLLMGVTVTVAVALCPLKMLRGVVGTLAVKSGGDFKATAKLFTSIEPSPVARSKPVPAE